MSMHHVAARHLQRGLRIRRAPAGQQFGLPSHACVSAYSSKPDLPDGEGHGEHPTPEKLRKLTAELDGPGAMIGDKIEPKDTGDPAVEALENVLHFNLAAAPPGAHMPRPTGGDKLEDLAEDPVGPRGKTPGPTRIPTPFELQQKRHLSTGIWGEGVSGRLQQLLQGRFSHMFQGRFGQPMHADAFHTYSHGQVSGGLRHFSGRIEVNPEGSGRAASLGDGDGGVLDAAAPGGVPPVSPDAGDMGTSAHINPAADPASLEPSDPLESVQHPTPPHAQNQPHVSRFDERPPGPGLGSEGSAHGAFSRDAQRSAAQSQASGMGTGGFMSPPSGESFSGADARPAVGAQGPPGAVKGLSPGEGEEGGTPSAKTQDEVAFEQVSGMETGGALNPRPGEAFAEDGSTRPSGAKGSRSFSTSAARGWAAAPTRAAQQAATKKIQTNPTTPPVEVPGEPGEGPEPVFAGTVVTLQTGVNTLGGTPVKPRAERARGGDQLRDDVDAMNPGVTPEVERMAAMGASKGPSGADGPDDHQ